MSGGEKKKSVRGDEKEERKKKSIKLLDERRTILNESKIFFSWNTTLGFLCTRTASYSEERIHCWWKTRRLFGPVCFVDVEKHMKVSWRNQDPFRSCQFNSKTESLILKWASWYFEPTLFSRGLISCMCIDRTIVHLSHTYAIKNTIHNPLRSKYPKMLSSIFFFFLSSHWNGTIGLIQSSVFLAETSASFST